tara:strand:- start:50 stop:640 length:591 start_codon:yes stop_codon:yes gene_type:complete
MGELRKDIKGLVKESGGKDKARRAAELWYSTGKSNANEKSVQSTGGRFHPGKIYVFRYNPKYRGELPWFDANPVVLALDADGSNDVGINLNLLPIMVKERVLDGIYTRFKDEINMQSIGARKNDAKRQGRLSINWDDAKGYLRSVGLDFAIRQYIPGRKSNQSVVSYENWAKIVLCDFADINGTTYGKLRYLFRKR